MANPNPRYIHGIPTRSVIEGPQNDDFIEEVEGRRGVFQIMNDGFTCRQGTDIMAYMSDTGSFHPRRYIVKMDIGFKDDDDDSYDQYNVIVIEDGPRITMSFPQIGPLEPGSGIVGSLAHLHNINTRLPRILSPTEERGIQHFHCFARLVHSSPSSTSDQILTFIINPDGTFEFDHLGSGPNPASMTVYPFCVVYDTGRI